MEKEIEKLIRAIELAEADGDWGKFELLNHELLELQAIA